MIFVVPLTDREPPCFHRREKLDRDRRTGARTDNRIDIAFRASRCLNVIHLFRHVIWREDGQAVEAAAHRAAVNLLPIIDRELVSVVLRSCPTYIAMSCTLTEGNTRAVSLTQALRSGLHVIEHDRTGFRGQRRIHQNRRSRPASLPEAGQSICGSERRPIAAPRRG
jgi:hypothetical protein